MNDTSASRKTIFSMGIYMYPSSTREPLEESRFGVIEVVSCHRSGRTAGQRFVTKTALIGPRARSADANGGQKAPACGALLGTGNARQRPQEGLHGVDR